MIDKIPGWLNFIILTVFYFGIFALIRPIFKIEIGNKDLLIICLFYAGGYLAKWREKQGGGWRFW